MKVFVSIPTESPVMRTFVADDVKAYLEEKFEVVYSPFTDRQVTKEEFIEYAKDADVVMTGWGHPLIDGEMIEKTAVKLIAHTGGSVGTLVCDETYDAGATVLSGNNFYAESVAEGTVGYILTGLRRIPDYVNSVKAGGWRPEGETTERLLEQTVGIVGLGAISRYLVRMLKPFRVNVKIFSRYPIEEEFLKENNATQASLEEIFSTCKIVSIHSSLTEKSVGMISKKHFDLLQDGALFINTSRGRIIVEEEMIEALKENRFKAVLDVYYNEPLEEDSLLRTLPNVYAIAHMAGPTLDMRAVITKNLADEIERFANKQPLTLEISKTYAARMTK